MSLDEVKIQLSREHYGRVAGRHRTPTELHLLAAIEIAERLIRENNRLEMECRKLRLETGDGSDSEF